MTATIPGRCVLHGEGVAVWEARLPEEPTVGFAESDADILASDAATYETVTLYRPVTVEVDGNDEPRAYYYRSAAERRLVNGGKVYVDPKHVHASPLPNAKRARKFGCEGPADSIDPEDVPDEVSS